MVQKKTPAAAAAQRTPTDERGIGSIEDAVKRRLADKRDARNTRPNIRRGQSGDTISLEHPDASAKGRTFPDISSILNGQSAEGAGEQETSKGRKGGKSDTKTGGKQTRTPRASAGQTASALMGTMQFFGTLVSGEIIPINPQIAPYMHGSLTRLIERMDDSALEKYAAIVDPLVVGVCSVIYAMTVFQVVQVKQRMMNVQPVGDNTEIEGQSEPDRANRFDGAPDERANGVRNPIDAASPIYQETRL